MRDGAIEEALECTSLPQWRLKCRNWRWGRGGMGCRHHPPGVWLSSVVGKRGKAGAEGLQVQSEQDIWPRPYMFSRPEKVGP